MTLEEIRKQYPQYDDLSDDQLLSGLHQKYYADMPYEDFAGRIGVQQPSLADKAAGAGEVALTMLSGAVAEPVAGIAGLAQAINPFAEEGAGADMVESVRDAMTYRPRTETGQDYLANTGEALKPVADAIEGAESWLGDAAFDATGSPAVAAAAVALPTAVLEALGAKGFRRTAKQAKHVDELLAAAAPDQDSLKRAASAIYKEIDDMGASVKADAYTKLVNKIKRETTMRGMDADITPAANKAVARFEEMVGKDVPLSDIETLREVAGAAAGSINNKREAMLGSLIIDATDDFLDSAGVTALNKAKGNVGKRYKVARQLWGQYRKSQMLDEAFQKADLQASGLENGIRIQFRQILNNPKKRRFLNDAEIKEMSKVVEGTLPANAAKLLGRFGFSEGNATNIIGGSISGMAGAGVGGAVAGPVGATLGAGAAMGGGQLARKVAQNITKGNAQFAQKLVEAGKDGRKIAQAYIDNVPKKAQSAAELSELLLAPDVALDKLPSGGLVKRAADIAARRRDLMTAATVGAAAGVTQEVSADE